MAEFDARTEKNLATLVPAAEARARKFLRLAIPFALKNGNAEVRVISGRRTYAEQDALYAQGRTKPGARVTNARGGQSNHNFGLAFDIGIFKRRGILPAKYLGDSAMYIMLGRFAAECGLEWGGDWHSIKDYPHYELATGKSLAELDKIFRRGGLDAIQALAGGQ